MRLIIGIFSIFMVILIFVVDGANAQVALVKDINNGPDSSSPSGLVVVDNTLFFAADDGTHGTELWMSNGTLFITSLVKDINPGNANSSPTGLTDVNGTLFFAADDGTHGVEL